VSQFVLTWLVLTYLLLASVRPAIAQPLPQLPASGAGSAPIAHERWGVAEGLPVNSITHLLQTRDGYLWVATLDGLVRFDGVRFTVFNTANSDLPSNRINRLVEGVNGDLWILTEQWHLVRLREGWFRTIVAPGDWQTPQTPFHVDADGTVWIGTRRGLARLVNDRPVPVAADVIREAVHLITRRRNGDLVVASATQGVWRLRTDRQPATATRLPAVPELGTPEYTALVEGPDGRLVLGVTGAVWTGRDTLRPIPTRTIPSRAPVLKAPTQPADGSVLLIIGSPVRIIGDQIQRLETATTPWILNPPLWTTGSEIWYAAGSTLRRDGQVVVDLSRGGRGEVKPEDITTGLLDREGSIWLGTYADGLHRLNAQVVQTIGTSEGLASDNVYGVAATRSGRIWAGSLLDGYSRVDVATGNATAFREGGSLGSSISFLEDARGVLWVGGRALKGPRHCTSAGERCRLVASNPQVDDVRALFEDRDGLVWVGAINGVFRGDTTRLVQDTAVAAVTTAAVRAFAQSADGAIWMGTTSGGLVRYANGRARMITTQDGLPSNNIRALHADPDGLLWVGTEGRGLAQLDTRDWRDPYNRSASAPRIATIDERRGLFDNVVHQILPDDGDRLWMSTNRGIFWVTRAEAIRVAEGRQLRLHPVGYTERDGMRNREGNGGYQPSGARTADGRLWFPTQAGVVIVDPRKVQTPARAPAVGIETVLAGDSVFVPANGQVELPLALRDLRIEFTALTLRDSRNVRFRYRLDDYDENWTDAGAERRAFYTKLPAGTYTFRVQASGPESDWYEPGATLRIAIPPRLLEQPEVRLGLALLIVALLILAIRNRIERARVRARELEQLVAERTTALREREAQLASQNATLAEQATELRKLDEARTRFFANVSHELRTPLTLTLGPLDNLQRHEQGDTRTKEWIDVAQRNAQRLLSLVNQILDVAKLEAGAVRLSPEPIELVAFIRELATRFGPAAQKKSISVHLEMPATFETRLDPDATEKIVSNLLSNAVKFTPPGGHVHLTLSTPPGLAVLTVRNTGPAIPPDQLAHIFDRFFQVDESNTIRQTGTGIGLSLVKELVDLQQGVIRVTSDTTGTVFVVTLPAARRDAAVTTTAEPAGKGAEVAESEARTEDRPTLLIVDDSDDLRTFISSAFVDRYKVLEASNGLEALALARTHLPDVIISDVMMPGLDGRELLRALRASPDTDFLTVILLTAQAENAQRLAGLEGGADDYLVKPFDPRELDVRVRNLLAARRRLRARFVEKDETAGEATVPARPEPADAADRRPVYSAEDQRYLARIASAIQAGLGDQEFGVGELADAVFQDRSHLFRRVRELTGGSPSEMLRDARMQEAARLLRQGDGTVADVAYTVGYKSVSHFCRAFQDRFLCSPSAYRSQAADASMAAP
jgi:signal transduction histidine kinase/ligand-binding sensor domain-containing protein/DNA-binding response OmpR family regulator